MLRFYLSRIILPWKPVEEKDILRSPPTSSNLSGLPPVGLSFTTLYNGCCVKFIYVDVHTKKKNLEACSIFFSHVTCHFAHLADATMLRRITANSSQFCLSLHSNLVLLKVLSYEWRYLLNSSNGRCSNSHFVF